LTQLRLAVRNTTRAATVVGFGPRFLHSTGQVYKGGPATGVFFVLTCDQLEDIAIKARKASFGTVELAQALGDCKMLADHGRPVLRNHLRKGPAQGLTRLVPLIVGILEKANKR
jgi:transaldolase/glucose-6-phosphate isomerase